MVAPLLAKKQNLMQINIQPIEKRVGVNSSGDKLDVFSIFQTIQGEGPFSGHPATFIRLAGCNLQCPGCDTDYTSKREKLSPYKIAQKAVETANSVTTVNHSDGNGRLVVITGGEPFRQNITPLCLQLRALNFKIQIETNGTLPMPHKLPDSVVIVCSPKTSSVHSSLVHRVNAYKYVLSHDSVGEDGLPIQVLNHKVHKQVFRPPIGALVYLQPMDSQNAKQNRLNVLAVMGSCAVNGYILQLQIHKYLGVD